MADRSQDEIMRLAERAVEDSFANAQKATALYFAVNFVGERLGVRREPLESDEEYRDRLIATGEVVTIEPDRVVFAGRVESVTSEIGFLNVGGEDG